MPRRPKSRPRLTCFYRPPVPLDLRAGADAGDPDALFELGRLYLEGRAETSRATRGESQDPTVVSEFYPAVPRNHVEAAALLQKAADQGHEGARQLLEVVKLHTPRGVH